MVRLCYNLFIPSSVDGYLNCFQFGAIMNNASINIHTEVLCGHIFPFLFGKYPRVDWPGPMVSICF